MSPDLIAFLKAWHDWATNGAPEGEPFDRWDGLCMSARWFGGAPLHHEIAKLFSCSFPFGVDEFWRRQKADTQHECPKRLAWVRERLIEAGESVS